MSAKKIKLGIDAKWYFNGPPSGLVVVKSLVDELRTKSDLIDLYLFIDKNSQTEARKVFVDENIKLIPLKAKPNLISNFFLIPFFANKYKLDFVIFQNFGSLLPMKFKAGIYIHDVLFLDYPQYFSKAELFYYKFMGRFAKNADFIIAISNSEKQRLIKHRLGTDESVHVIYHGISDKFKSIEYYQPEEIERFNKTYNLSDKYLLYVGRVNIRKNLINLVKALNQLDDKSTTLVIVGKEDHKNDDISTYLKENNLGGRIKFTGHIPENDLYIMYAKAYVFCFPSFAEGFGLPPIEAMQCGIPSVVSDRTSLPEVCGDAALYINPDNPADIAEKINMLFENDALYNLKKQQSIVQAQKYSWKKAAETLIQILSC